MSDARSPAPDDPLHEHRRRRAEHSQVELATRRTESRRAEQTQGTIHPTAPIARRQQSRRRRVQRGAADAADYNRLLRRLLAVPYRPVYHRPVVQGVEPAQREATRSQARAVARGEGCQRAAIPPRFLLHP